MTESIEELAGGSKATMTETVDADAEVQCDPIVTDARVTPSDLCFAYYANYPSTGSAFAGPWRCSKGNFYNGVPIQIEFDGADDEWEPCGRPASFWRRTQHAKVPLCALIEESTLRQQQLAGAATVQTVELARASPDDAGGATRVLVEANEAKPQQQAQPQPPPARLSPDDAGGGGSGGGGYKRVAYVLSRAPDSDALLCSRGYASAEGGHCGEMWRLVRVGDAPRPGVFGPGRLSMFAGSWQCDRGSFYGGSVVEIDVDGDVTRWFPRGGSLATYRKVDLVDLVERSLERDERYLALSEDDGGLAKPGFVEHHNICSLSASQHTLTVSRSYDDDGHCGETWTLDRILDCGGAALSAQVGYRTYRYVYASSGSGAAHAEATRALSALRSVQFNGAREAETKRSARGIAQAWSVDHLDGLARSHNHEVLTSVAAILRASPELVCEVHGTTTTPRVCDAELAAHFGLDAATQMREVMDALARERATSCLEQLVGRGVDRRRLRVTFKGCTGESRVHFIARAVFRGGPAVQYDMRDDAEAIFARYDRDLSGSIDAQELRTALHDLGLKADAAQAAAILLRYDTDRSERLELGEFKKLVRELRRFKLAADQPRGTSTSHEAAQEVKAAAAAVGIEPKDQIDEAFLKYDADRSGDIDVNELRTALRDLGLRADTSEAARVLARFDADKSFRLEIGEFRRLVAEIRRFQMSVAPPAPPAAPAAPAAPAGSPSKRVTLPPPGAAQSRSQAGAAPLPKLGALPPPSGAGPINAAAATLPAAGESVGTVFRRYAKNDALDVSQLRTALKELKLPASTNLEKQAKEGRSALDKQQFRALVKALKAGGPDATPNESVGDVFRRFDADSSGSLDVSELKAALSDLGLPVDTAAAAEVLQRYDEDRSGRIEMAEFRKLVKELKGFQASQK